METDESFELLIGIQSYSDEELKSLAAELEAAEKEVSRHRRILHGKLDILRAEMVRRLRDKHRAGESLIKDDDISRLTEVLSARAAATEAPARPQED